MWKSDSKFRRFWTVWPQLKLEDGVLDRVKQSPGSSDSRPLIVLPQRLLDKALCQLHDNSGHFGVERLWLARLTDSGGQRTSVISNAG